MTCIAITFNERVAAEIRDSDMNLSNAEVKALDRYLDTNEPLTEMQVYLLNRLGETWDTFDPNEEHERNYNRDIANSLSRYR